MVCRDFILPEPASYVFFYAFSNLRNLLYIIKAHAKEVLLINHSHDIRFFLIDSHMAVGGDVISIWDAHGEDAPL